MSKSIILTIFLYFYINFSSASEWTVSNNPNIPAQYTSIQEAIDEAQNGDKILVHASPNFYAGFDTYDKKLEIIGEGFNGSKTTVIDLYNGVGGSSTDPINLNNSSVLTGFRIVMTIINQNVVVGLSSSSQVKNCYFDNIRILRMFDGSIIRNSIIHNSRIDLYNDNNFILNNIFIGTSHIYDLSGENSNINGLIVRNNLFINGSSNSSIQIPDDIVSGIIITDNIFYKSFQTVEYCPSCEFSNNLFFENTSLLPEEEGNINNQDPKFSFVPADLNEIFSFNFTLQESSPAKGIATDNGDLGIYGGSYPMPEILDGKPTLPVIKTFTLKNIVVGENGNLELVIKAKAN